MESPSKGAPVHKNGHYLERGPSLRIHNASSTGSLTLDKRPAEHQNHTGDGFRSPKRHRKDDVEESNDDDLGTLSTPGSNGKEGENENEMEDAPLDESTNDSAIGREGMDEEGGSVLGGEGGEGAGLENGGRAGNGAGDAAVDHTMDESSNGAQQGANIDSDNESDCFSDDANATAEQDDQPQGDEGIRGRNTPMGVGTVPDDPTGDLEESPGIDAAPVQQPFEGFDEEPIPVARLENIKLAQQFAEDVRHATLENSKLDPATILQLRYPTAPEPLDDLSLFHLQLYLVLSEAPENIYNGVKDVIDTHFPDLAIPSLFIMRGKVDKLTAITAITDDMCVNGCHAFTGPLATLDNCSVCGEPRFEQRILAETNKKVPRKSMTTLPLGPQIQALRQSAAGARAMRYRDQKTKKIIEEMKEYTSMKDHIYDDIFSGSDYLKLYDNLKLTEDDTLVNFSMDGAQLYQNKKSDTWIAIWIVQDYDPKTRFKRKHALPAFIVPGPHKPKNLDSYTYRSMHHLSAIQREDQGRGIKCWDGVKAAIISSRTILFLNMADTVGLIDVDGRVPHHGARGCRVACDMLGRHKPGQGHYYPAHLLPDNYTVLECSHPDVELKDIKPATVEGYNSALALLEGSVNMAAYEQHRYKTGISKRSIISGLVPQYTLPPPKAFSVDLMHLFWINLGELIIPLFRAKLKCEPTDNIATWDWAVLQDDNWIHFGKLVAQATPYFPSSFERPPRNPAEKINSKYKATEYFLLLFGLGPGLLRFFLPRKYWRHFCKLVRTVRILTQRKITHSQLVDARYFAIQFVDEYELYYYQRRVDRIHFCRPAIHTLLHVPLETGRVGPGAYYTQFENERAIGDFGKEIRQPSNPFGNLAQIAVRQSRKNALKIIYPELDPEKPLPRGALDVGDSYIFLSPRTRSRALVFGAAGLYLKSSIGTDRIKKYGRMRLPNQQVLRSLFAESSLIKRAPRISRNAKLLIGGDVQIGEVQFFFLQVAGHDPVMGRETKIPKALVSLYAPRIEEIWEDSYKTLWVCTKPDQPVFQIVEVSSILACVSMQPMPSLPGDPENLWFVVEKSGIDDIVTSGYSEPID
ncbi:hypothetical protein MD484_g8629, partial [Candolleomyces efflorescens]